MPNYRLERSSRVLLISTRQKKKISSPSNEITTSGQPPSRLPLDLPLELSRHGMTLTQNHGPTYSHMVNLSPQFSLYLVSPNLFHLGSGIGHQPQPVLAHTVRNRAGESSTGHRPPVGHPIPTSAKNRASTDQARQAHHAPRHLFRYRSDPCHRITKYLLNHANYGF